MAQVNIQINDDIKIKADPFYSESNMKHLNAVFDDEKNNFKNFHIHELIETDEND